MDTSKVYSVALPEGFKESGEAVDFLSDFGSRLLAAIKDDGKLTLAEIFTLAPMLGTGIDAVNGANQIGGEFSDALKGSPSKLFDMISWCCADAASDLREKGL